MTSNKSLWHPWNQKVSTVKHHLVLGHWWNDITKSTLKRLTSNKSLWHPWNQKVSTVRHHLVLGHLWSYITKSPIKRLTSNNFTFVLCIFFSNPMVKLHLFEPWKLRTKVSTVRHHFVLGHWWSDLTQSTLKRLTSNNFTFVHCTMYIFLQSYGF